MKREREREREKNTRGGGGIRGASSYSLHFSPSIRLGDGRERGWLLNADWSLGRWVGSYYWFMALFPLLTQWVGKWAAGGHAFLMPGLPGVAIRLKKDA